MTLKNIHMKKSTKTTSRLSACSALICFLILVLASLNGSAQNRWRATLGAGANFPTRSLGRVDLKTGGGFDAAIAYRVMPHLFVGTGWGWNRFASDDPAEDTDFEETGYVFELRFIHPLPHARWSYTASAGATYKHIEAENSEGTIVADTGHGWGWQADAGLSVPLGKKVHLEPTVRYRALARHLQQEAANVPAHLNYLSATVGLSWKFGKRK